MKYFIRLFIIYANAIWFINIKINILSIKNRNRTQKRRKYKIFIIYGINWQAQTYDSINLIQLLIHLFLSNTVFLVQFSKCVI